MTISEFVEKYKINKSFLARQLGMNNRTFMSKWNQKNTSFRINEVAKLAKILQSMQREKVNEEI